MVDCGQQAGLLVLVWQACSPLMMAACWYLFVPAVNVYLPKDRVTNNHQGYGFVEFRAEEDADYVSVVDHCSTAGCLLLSQVPPQVQHVAAVASRVHLTGFTVYYICHLCLHHHLLQV